MTVKAYGASAADQPVQPLAIERRSPGPGDVQIVGSPGTELEFAL